MHALQLLHKTFSKALPTLHLARLTSLMSAVEGLLRGRELWLTGVGRHLRGKALEKHKIKRIDRLSDFFSSMLSTSSGLDPRPLLARGVEYAEAS